MNHNQMAAVLLRELWWHYDHGGHSGRSWHAQILETTVQYRNRLLSDVPSEIRAEHVLKLEDLFPETSEQFRLFLEIRYATDEEALKIVLWGMLLFYKEEQHSAVETELISAAAKYIGLPEDGGTYRLTYGQYDPWELISELRVRATQPQQY